jgi:hypothetical protein
MVTQSLMTPSCTLSSMTEEGAARTLELLTELSSLMRQKYS